MKEEKMKDMIKGVLRVALAVSLAVMPVSLSAAETTNTAPRMGSNAAGLHQNLDYYGAKVLRISNSTTASLLVTGPVFLDAICVMRGTLGAYAMAEDSAVATNETVDNAFDTAITPNVYTAKDSTSAQHGDNGCWIPRFPIKVVNGLVGMNSASDITSLFYVHSSSGVNPSTLGAQ